MSRTAFLLVPALLAGLLAAPGAAATTTLTVEAAGSGWVDLDLPDGVRVDLHAGTFRSLTGQYAGFYLRRLADEGTEPVTSNWVWLTRVRLPGSRTTGHAPSDPVWSSDIGPVGTGMSGGRYRLHVFTDGAFAYQVPVTGLAASVTLSPAHPAASSLRVAPATRTGRVWRARDAVTVGPRTAGVSLGEVTYSGTAANDGLVCLAERDGGCHVTPRYRPEGVGAVGGAGPGFTVNGPFLHPGAVPAGPADTALVVADAAGNVTGARAVTLLFEAP